MPTIKVSTATQAAINLRLAYSKTPVNERNLISAERGYRVKGHQLSPEARHARTSGTFTEKAIDYPTQRTAKLKWRRYTSREERQLIEWGQKALATKNWGILQPWCRAHGRNFMAVVQKCRKLLKTPAR